VPSTSVAVHSAGVPIYFSGRRGIDVFGLSDRHIARLQVTDLVTGHRFEKRRGGGRKGPRGAGRERAAYDGIE
ncbi:MAG: hypothetical protein V3T07_09845, partial [Myxococcota bacterium]